MSESVREPKYIEHFMQKIARELYEVSEGKHSINRAMEIARKASALINLIEPIMVKTETDATFFDGEKIIVLSTIERNEIDAVLNKIRENSKLFFTSRAFQLNSVNPYFTEKGLFVFRANDWMPESTTHRTDGA